MKKKITLTFTNILFIVGTFIFSLLLSQIGRASEGSSFEVLCRNKAKEIAADTYKGCMTEYRQSKLEQIRKEYKEELSNLKNQYDKKLKKLSGMPKKNENDKEAVTITSIELKKSKIRSSGARMPVKKSGSGTQVIDLSKPVDSQINDSDETIEASRAEKKDPSENNDIEIVELPTQQ